MAMPRPNWDNQPTASLQQKERLWVSVYERQPASGARVEIVRVGQEKRVTPGENGAPDKEEFVQVTLIETVLWCSAYKRDQQVKKWRYALSVVPPKAHYSGPILNPRPAAVARPSVFHRVCLRCAAEFFTSEPHIRTCDSCRSYANAREAGAVGG
jgi:hypothetical protein